MERVIRMLPNFRSFAIFFQFVHYHSGWKFDLIDLATLESAIDVPPCGIHVDRAAMLAVAFHGVAGYGYNTQSFSLDPFNTSQSFAIDDWDFAHFFQAGEPGFIL